MLKILQTRRQQYVNRELPYVQAGFRNGRGNRDQIANICWIMEIQVYALTGNAEEAEVEQFYEDLQDLIELTPKKKMSFSL